MLLTYKDNNKRQDPLNQANKIVPIGKAYNDDGTLKYVPFIWIGHFCKSTC